MANEARYFGEEVLRLLHEESELARRWLRARPRGALVNQLPVGNC